MNKCENKEQLCYKYKNKNKNKKYTFKHICIHSREKNKSLPEIDAEFFTIDQFSTQIIYRLQ